MITKEYAVLFDGVCKVAQQMEDLTRELKAYQQMAEEAYIEREEDEAPLRN